VVLFGPRQKKNPTTDSTDNTDKNKIALIIRASYTCGGSSEAVVASISSTTTAGAPQMGQALSSALAESDNQA
jgi:hypothetical protein